MAKGEKKQIIKKDLPEKRLIESWIYGIKKRLKKKTSKLR